MSLEKAIIRYETARQQVQNLTEERRNQEYECTSYFYSETENAMVGEYCLVSAFESAVSGWGRGNFVFEKILNNGDYCEACKKSYAIKVGPLAEAKQELGRAKRSLTVIGKRLMREGES